ncbi:ABC-2 type transport system permease protein [Comamonas sp. BIGb0152]|uniref:DUF3526 domain-containing protein n=1 Tax=Comamonas sp. BIGb0152 TaxID=2940601 RepID=UPI002167A791|nr:DUF3526 domain-containing protein [Comamonas sp. BIGb0152]MCS4292562.1 ABC-2 type transport system permease protein [Comamonas sp. BIGb0152]
MMASIALKEARSLLRDGRLWTLGLVLVLLFVAMLTTASIQRNAAERERSQVERVARQQWDNQGDKNPHRAAHFGMYAFKPQSLLSSVDPGVDSYVGQAMWLEPHKRNMALFSPAADATPSIGLGPFTPAFVLLVLVPLLIAVLGHSTITQERESGTLRMLHACGMDGRSLLVGKWIGITLALFIVLLPISLVSTWMLSNEHYGGALAALGLALLAYYIIWVGATVLVSVHCNSSRMALLVLTALWVAWVFLVPRISASVVDRWAPLPTGTAFWQGIGHDIQNGLPGDGSAADRMKAFDAKLMVDNGVSRLEDLPFGANAKRRLYRDSYSTKVHQLHFKRLWSAQFHQQKLLNWMSFISPYGPMGTISTAMAGTDLAHRQHFEMAAEAYREKFTTRMDEWDLASTKGVTSFEDKYAGNAQWQAIPEWRYQAPGTGFAIEASALAWAQLLAWFTAVAGCLWLSARRLNP